MCDQEPTREKYEMNGKGKKVIFCTNLIVCPNMSCTRSRTIATRENPLSIYSSQLEAYANKYMASFDGSESLQEWSSRHAQRFSTTVNKHVPMVVITRDLEDYVSKNKTQLKVTRYHLEQDSSAQEWAKGRTYFNKLLFAEFENWYSAFEAEAEEDDGPSAASRWTYHCAKKLSRTGLSVDSLVPVVEAWLNQHLDS